MANTYDVVIIGLGAMGSAALYQCARANVNVIGIDQFYPPHTFGSSHGDTRIIRRACGEGETYTKLSSRSYQIWQDIERGLNVELLTKCGALIVEPDCTRQSAFFTSTVELAQRFNIGSSIMPSHDLAKALPQFRYAGNEIGYYEYGGGFLRPEACIAANLSLAKNHGAATYYGERVINIVPASNGCTVITNKSIYSCDHVIVTAGPWINMFTPLKYRYRELLKVYRQLVCWFEPASPAMFDVESFPVFIWLYHDVEDSLYGFPRIDSNGVKVAVSQYDSAVDPDHVDRSIRQRDIDHLYDTYISRFLPKLQRTCLRATACLYTVTPDSNFIIDRHPDMPRVVLVSPCSGHGFKHSAAIGEALVELINTGESTIDLGDFGFARFG